MKNETRIIFAVLIFASIALMLAGFMIDYMSVENAALRIALMRREMGETSPVIEGEFREKTVAKTDAKA